MALSFVGPLGQQITPGVLSSVNVQQASGAVASTGILVLMGEAQQGPDFSLELDLSNNFFSPGDLASVQSKYGSGRLVEAFNLASAASSDPNIPNAPSAIYLVKTNVSTKASLNLLRSGLSNYGVLADKSYGAAGNGLSSSVSAAVAEVPASSGAITWIPSPSGATVALRVNGGAKQTLAVSAKAGGVVSTDSVSELAFVGQISSGSATGLNSLTGVMATGGISRGPVAGFGGGNTLALAATGNSVVITLGAGALTAWAVSPVVGDTLIIPANGEYGAGADSVIKGGAAQNEGAYVVTAVSATTVTATKLRNNVGGGLVAPANVAAATILNATDVMCFSPVVVQDQVGVNRGLLTGLVGQNVTGTALNSGASLQLVLATGQVWNALPQVGDYLFIPSTAPANYSNNAGGWYSVTAASSGVGAGQSSITALRLSNGVCSNFVATAVAAVTDIQCLRPVVDGLGKALEIYDGGGAESIAQQLYTASGVLVSWLSAPTAPQLLVSASEYSVNLVDALSVKNVSETLVAGGAVALLLGYNGTTASVTVSDTTLSTSVVGGFGANLSLSLSQFQTLGQLASYIATQTGYSCQVASALYGQLLLQNQESNSASTVTPRVVLDAGTYNICSENGAMPGRIKVDASSFFKVVSNSLLVQEGSAWVSQAAAGLPEVQAVTFMSGGAIGGSSNASFVSALSALQNLVCNFIVPLVSQDATADIAVAATDATSTYTVDSVNSLVNAHAVFMSGLTIAKNRQAFLSKRASYSAAKVAAQNIASFRSSMAFQDFKGVSISGALTQFQPWMSAVAAAAMQAGAGYKPVVHKFINTSGMLVFDGSFNSNNPAQRQDALQNGLYYAEKAPNGGYRWVSDQTTYTVDNNFVYNSFQAVYDTDTIALTLQQNINTLDIGQSLADLSPGLILAQIDAIMGNLINAKFVATSTQFPKGYANVQVKINAPGAVVSLTAVGSTGLYFCQILTNIANVVSSAG